MERECMNGQTEESMTVNGKIITCTEKESTHGKMAEDMRETISMIGSTDSVYTPGKTEDNISGTGKMENNMVKEHIDKQEAKRRKEFGKMEKELNGWNENSCEIL
jgi:hypothetical protein